MALNDYYDVNKIRDRAYADGYEDAAQFFVREIDALQSYLSEAEAQIVSRDHMLADIKYYAAQADHQTAMQLIRSVVG